MNCDRKTNFFFTETKTDIWKLRRRYSGGYTMLPLGDEKMDSRSHSFGQSTYHFVWCTKYRYRVLGREDIKIVCNDSLARASERHESMPGRPL
jgi:hypothetical protein